jgi:hypothetical protein
MSELEDDKLLHRIDTKLAIVIIKLAAVDASLSGLHGRFAELEKRIAQITVPPEIAKVHG